jgi:EAL domain-containing protein (putative c-di-GMP-specific phosphodiesterase class I)
VRLVALGCDLGEGFLFAKPASTTDLTPNLVRAPDDAASLAPIPA